MTITNFITIDEIGLLPGTAEPTEISGALNLDYTKSFNSIQFSPLISQSIAELNLSAGGKPLFYTFENNQHDLIAKSGANGDMVFKASLTNEGTFQFILYQSLDRESPKNLISEQTIKYKINHDYGDHQEIGFAYQASTIPNHAYQLSFYYSPQSEMNSDINIYWGSQLLYTLPASTSKWTGFNFPLLGSPDEYSELKFVMNNNTNNNITVDNILQNVTLIDSGQQQLPLPFQFYCDNEPGFFTVNVTTDVPILASNDPFNIIYEQSVYQNIIVEGGQNNSSQTKINLDSLFESMNISPEHRHVEVVHNTSSYYTVHISDSSELVHNPITVADIRLSFEGEDDGLDTFFKHVQFDL